MSTTEDPTVTPPEEFDARPDAPDEHGSENDAPHLPFAESVRDIADALDLPEKIVDVPEWGFALLMRGLSLGEVDDLQTQHPDGGYTYLLKLVAASIVKPPFTLEQASVLSEKSAVVMEGVIKEALRLNGLSAALERAMVEQFPDGRAQTAPIPSGGEAENAGGGAA